MFSMMEALVDDGVRAVKRGDTGALGDIMNMNQGLLCGLGLSSQPIDEMIARLRGYGALGAKLTGAGGDGGAVIALFSNTKAILPKLQSDGVECFVTPIGGTENL
jgi:mevalonate kinase